MNIFKALASGRNSFKEEYASALIAWLLNPYLDHGLGASFLCMFLQGINKYSFPRNSSPLQVVIENIELRLRKQQQSSMVFNIDLEYKPDKSEKVVDVVLFVEDKIHSDNWIISIENKIWAKSCEEGQLEKQYHGWKASNEWSDWNIGIIYLVPADTDIHPDLLNEYEKQFVMEGRDFKSLVTWQRNKDDEYPSISKQIIDILDLEAHGMISPIPEYARHTLKALNSFINEDFSGYDEDEIRKIGGLNEATESTLTIDEISGMTNGYVGVQFGISGLLRTEIKILDKYRYQYSSKDMSTKRNWIEVKEFKKVINWIRGIKEPEIKWCEIYDWKPVPMPWLAKILTDYPHLYVGVKGGIVGLSKLEPSQIQNGKWSISSSGKGSQWMRSDEFLKIISDKGIVI